MAYSRRTMERVRAPRAVGLTILEITKMPDGASTLFGDIFPDLSRDNRTSNRHKKAAPKDGR